MPVLSLASQIAANFLLLSHSNSNYSIHHRLLNPTNLAFHSLPFKSHTIPPLSFSSRSRRRRHPICSPRKRVRCSSSVGNGQNLPHDPNGDEQEEAREAVRQLLREHGASQEDSFYIASNSPKYLKLLVESVRELDEHSLWSSWNAAAETQEDDEGEDITSLGFKEKVYYMAKSKGDGGILPFLESTGLKHSSATFIAGYLSSEGLPDLITKVRFLKDMLFSSRSHEELIGRNARRMMKHLSISIDDDIQRTLSFFEKLEAKQGGLNILGYEDASFPYLIESFRKLLMLSVENHLKPLVEFLEQIGVPKESARIILLLFPPILLYDVEKDIKPRVRELEKAGVEDKDIGRMLLKYPWILSSSIQENYEKILEFFHDKKVVSFMKEIGFDDRTTGRILCRCPEIFAANVDNTLRRKIKFLTDFGILTGQLPRVIRKYPELLLLDIHQTLLPRMRYLMKIGLSKKDVCSMVFKFSPLLGYSVDVVLKPKLEFLSRTMQKSLKEVVEYPRYFSYSLEKKIKYRFSVLKSRNIECSLRDMLAMNDIKFAEQYDLLVPLPSSSGGDEIT